MPQNSLLLVKLNAVSAWYCEYINIYINSSFIIWRDFSVLIQLVCVCVCVANSLSMLLSYCWCCIFIHALHTAQDSTFCRPLLSSYLTPSFHLLQPTPLSPYFLHSHTSTRPMPFRPSHIYSTIILLCHQSLQTDDDAPLLTEFTATISASPPLSVFLSSSLIPFRGKSILLGSGLKSCSSKQLGCLSWFGRGMM